MPEPTQNRTESINATLLREDACFSFIQALFIIVQAGAVVSPGPCVALSSRRGQGPRSRTGNDFFDASCEAVTDVVILGFKIYKESAVDLGVTSAVSLTASVRIALGFDRGDRQKRFRVGDELDVEALVDAEAEWLMQASQAQPRQTCIQQ